VKLHAFLATVAELPRALRDGAEGFSGTLLSGGDPANLSSLFELVTRGALPADEALAQMDQPVAQAGPDGPWVYAVPALATEALAAASTAELDGWARDWSGADRVSASATSSTVHALAGLAARATADQSLYIRLESPPGTASGAKDLPRAGAKDLH
jgi:hypothetical protein